MTQQTGLPPSELQVAQYGFAFFRFILSKNRALAKFERNTKKILTRVDPIIWEALNQQVKIPRVPGIEEVSTNWSIAMTLRHLNDVNSGMLGVIQTLANSSTGLAEVKIADYKPDPVQPETIISDFKDMSEKFVSEVRRLSSLGSTPKHPHPWFGPLNAHGWLCLAALHQGIHAFQIKMIEKGLSS